MLGLAEIWPDCRIDLLRRERIASISRHAQDDGACRSGSALAENIVSDHSDITATRETNLIARKRVGTTFPSVIGATILSVRRPLLIT